MAQSHAPIRMSDAAVQEKTGKVWAEWFAVLDAASAAMLNHKEIVELLGKNYPGISGWWQQMVTVTYEQARGLRDTHQRPEGYEISVSKTLAADVSSAYQAWVEDESRSHWLGGQVEIRKATPNKSLRVAWIDDGTSLNVDFYAKGESRCQVVVQHGKLRDAEAAASMKAYWAEALGRLKGLLKEA